MKIYGQRDHFRPWSSDSSLLYGAELHLLEKSSLKQALHFIKAHLDDVAPETASLTSILSTLGLLGFIGPLGISGGGGVESWHANYYISHRNKLL